MKFTPRIKICCISSTEEAQLTIAQGAAALGLVAHMPSGPGVIDEALIAAIAAAVPPPIATFLLTSAQDAATIIAQQRQSGVNTLQLVDAQEPATYAALRTALPGVKLVQVIHIIGPESLEAARAIAPHVDGLLLDSGNPGLPIKELGGTGRVHNWQISRQIRDQAGVQCSWQAACAPKMSPRRFGSCSRSASMFAPACAPKADWTPKSWPASWRRYALAHPPDLLLESSYRTSPAEKLR